MSALPDRMRACRIHTLGALERLPEPLTLEQLPLPALQHREVLIRISICGVCHTELDEIEGRAPPPVLPVVPGHQVVGQVVDTHPDCESELAGRWVGVAWIHSSCGSCRYCVEGRENLCAAFRGCGRDADGGYAEYMAAPEAFVHPLPPGLSPRQAAPLLCAGAVGLRAIRLCELRDGQAAGLTGFGASGHLVLQMLKHLYPASKIHVFARNPDEREFARELGAHWVGDTADQPPENVTAIIDTTPAWRPVLAALRVLEPGGRLVINAISKESADRAELLNIDYTQHLWREKILRTVTNVTRTDVRDCLQLACDIPLAPEVQCYPLEQANRALHDIRTGAGRGAKVLIISGGGTRGLS